MILPGTGADGAVLGDALFQLGHGPEAADHDTLVLTVSVADEPEWVLEFADLLEALGLPMPLGLSEGEPLLKRGSVTDTVAGGLGSRMLPWW